MNAAFLLVTTALLAGQNAPQDKGGEPAGNKPAVTSQAPAAAPVTGGCCGGDCGAASSCGCCDSGWGAPRQGLFSRLRGAFSRGSDCGCDTGHHRSIGWGGDCGCGNSGGGLFSRLRSKLRGGYGDCGCASDCGCNGCGGGAYNGAYIGAPGAPGKVEQLQNPPKEEPGNKMPKGDEGKNSGSEPPTAQLRPSVPAAPALQAAPAIVPNVPANNQEQRDPPF